MNDPASVLIVDDVADNIHLLREVLKGRYVARAAINGAQALEICRSEDPPDLVLLDIMMPDMDGYEVCRQLKADPKTRGIPVIFVTAKGETEDERYGLELGAVDYITKPIRAPIVETRVATHLKLYDQQRHLEGMVTERTAQLEDTKREVIYRLGVAAEYKDEETGLHVKRMSHYSALLARRLGLGNEFEELMLKAAPMHDLGKIGIPDRVLLKPGKLDDEEWRVMQNHAEIGAQILSGGTSDLLKLAEEIALTHHEKWNGKGYPRGLKGEEIPISGRIVAVADVFDALTSERPYKNAWTVDDAMNLIRKERGEHFDPQVADTFLDSKDEIVEIKERFAEPGGAGAPTST